MPNRPKLLLVEDDAAAALHRTRTLTAAGFAVTEARTMAEGAAAFGRMKFHIVLSDIRLPDGNGYELCRTLHRQAPNIPVVLISAAYIDDAEITLEGFSPDTSSDRIRGYVTSGGPVDYVISGIERDVS